MSLSMYHSPEKFGLTTIGEIEWGWGGYSHDITVVWRRICDGAFMWGEDTGCSCSLAFDCIGVDGLTVLRKRGGLADLKKHLDARNGNQESLGNPDRQSDIATLIERMYAAGAR